MTLFHDDVYDDGLQTITDNADALHLCSADPELTWANIASYSLGSKSSPTVGAPTDRAGGGRKVVVSAIIDGAGTGTGTVTHYALVDTGNTKILVSGALDSSRTIENGDIFLTPEFDIGIPTA